MKLCFPVFRYEISVADDPCCYPLGAMYISAYAKKLGHTVRILNFHHREYDLFKEFEGQDAILFTGSDPFLRQIAEAAAIAHSMGIHTVAGGATATHRPEVMRGIVDSVVMGEGEGALAAALAGEGVFSSPPVPLYALPWPDYEGFGIEEYNQKNSVRYMGVLASRGCPFRCHFCAHTTIYRARPLSDVFAEIDHYKTAYSVEIIVFNDNTLNVSRERFLSICEGMKERGLKWSAAIRADRFDEDMARAAKAGGCRYFVVGVESFLQDRLDKMGKGTKIDDNVRTLDLLHKHEIPYHGNLMVGFDFDSPEDIYRELDAGRRGYNVFPLLFRQFCGVKAKPGLSKERFDELQAEFSKLHHLMAGGGYFMWGKKKCPPEQTVNA